MPIANNVVALATATTLHDTSGAMGGVPVADVNVIAIAGTVDARTARFATSFASRVGADVSACLARTATADGSTTSNSNRARRASSKPASRRRPGLQSNLRTRAWSFRGNNIAVR